MWDWVNTHYADEDISTQAEVVAHLAESRGRAWGRGWDRVVAMVARALRAVGFVPDGITAAETRSLIEGWARSCSVAAETIAGRMAGRSSARKSSQQE